MGKAAHGTCRWGAREGRITALLEANELILRGEIRARLDLRKLSRVRARDALLTFERDGEAIEIDLGVAAARSWAAAIATPPPSLARKLAITEMTRLHVAGTIEDDALRAAIAVSANAAASAAVADLAIVRTDDLATLIGTIDALRGDSHVPPIWVVYIKGRAAPLGESAVREALRQRGFIDTKVAAISERLTALRFVLRFRNLNPHDEFSDVRARFEE